MPSEGVCCVQIYTALVRFSRTQQRLYLLLGPSWGQPVQVYLFGSLCGILVRPKQNKNGKLTQISVCIGLNGIVPGTVEVVEHNVGM